MYAVVATVTVTGGWAASEALPAMRLDMVLRAPGFVGACWLKPVDGIGMAVIIFPNVGTRHPAAACLLPSMTGTAPRTVGVRAVYAGA